MKRMITWMVVIGFGAAISGCTGGTPRPTVYAYPEGGQTAQQQSQDTTECQNWAQQQTGYNSTSTTAKGAGLGAVIGAVGGAAAGAAIGAAAGGGSGAAKGALIGVAAGGIGGAATGGAVNHSKGKKSFNRAYASCMKARGYAVDQT